MAGEGKAQPSGKALLPPTGPKGYCHGEQGGGLCAYHRVAVVPWRLHTQLNTVPVPLCKCNFHSLTNFQIDTIFDFRTAISSRQMVHLNRPIYEIVALGADLTVPPFLSQSVKTVVLHILNR
jgi:hypothetical protein